MDVDSDDEDSDGSNVPKKKVSVNRKLTYILRTAMPVHPQPAIMLSVDPKRRLFLFLRLLVL
jgi:hypothetical protein